MTNRLPALFLGHGSPMTVITDNPSRASFVELGKRLPRPAAILTISAHYETQGATHVTAGDHPRTIHDFRGFPPELFAMQYPAPGSAGLVARIGEVIGANRIVASTDWGFDHGTWGVLQPMYPDADIPVVAMSLNRSLDGDGHLAIGKVLAPLRDEGVLIVGSGNVVHNLALWRQSQGTVPDWAADFTRRVNAAVSEGDSTALTRFAPDDSAAGMAINSAEHYLPLLYTVATRLPGDEVAVFNDTIDGALSMTSYLIGDAALADGLGAQ
ncbi:MAG: 4,5-DOPA dioxygenase extradiol [Sphingomonadales bacterium]|nr:4,5-DOPA dioxygenase extradiol [Sphingomonadales bacterium]